MSTGRRIEGEIPVLSKGRAREPVAGRPQLAPFAYFPADQNGWYGNGSTRHYPQPAPDGSRTPVPQYLPPQ